MLRRRALLAAPALLLPRRASAQASGAELLLFCVADLHSASATAPQLVAAVDAALAAHPDAEAMILVNGDVFERGNAIARRSDGAGDWALLDALRDRAPVVLNIGNHETALVDDLAEVVRRARERDLVVVSSIRDARTGRPVADTRMRWPLRRQRQLGLVGIATDDAATYREAARAELILPEPVAWARAVLPWALDGADVRVVLSHAGLAADRAILPLLPDGTLMIGGHEHLRLTHAAGATRYVHTGSWGRFLTVAAWVGGVGWRLAEVPLTRDGPGDAALAARLRDVAEAHLAPEDREVVARLPRALPLPAAARLAAGAVAPACGTQAGALGHSGFGDGLPAGEVTRLDLDAFLRFDGALHRAPLDAAARTALRSRVNQEEGAPFAARIGDFAWMEPAEGGSLAVNGWVRGRAAHFLGSGALPFEEVPGLRLKAVVEAALRGPMAASP